MKTVRPHRRSPEGWEELIHLSRNPSLLANCIDNRWRIVTHNDSLRSALRLDTDQMPAHLDELPFLRRRKEDQDAWNGIMTSLQLRVADTVAVHAADPPDPQRPALHLRQARQFILTADPLPEVGWCKVSFAETTDLHDLIARDTKFPEAWGPHRGREFIRSYVDHHHPFAVVFSDLDYFGFFNKKMGEKAGDLVIQAKARFTNTHMRENDACFREGGDEFVFVLSLPWGLVDPLNYAETYFMKLAKIFMEEGIDLGEQIAYVGFSFGVVTVTNFESPVPDPDQLINSASKRMNGHKTMKKWRSRAKSIASGQHEEAAPVIVPKKGGPGHAELL